MKKEYVIPESLELRMDIKGRILSQSDPYYEVDDFENRGELFGE